MKQQRIILKLLLAGSLFLHGGDATAIVRRPDHLDMRIFKFSEHAKLIKQGKLDKIRDLIESGEMNPNQVSPIGWHDQSFLHVAVIREKSAIVQLLLEKGADPTHTSFKDTALSLAQHYFQQPQGNTPEMLKIIHSLEIAAGIPEEEQTQITQKPHKNKSQSAWEKFQKFFLHYFHKK